VAIDLMFQITNLERASAAFRRLLKMTGSAAVVLILASCGGGGGTAPAPTPQPSTPPPAPVTLSGNELTVSTSTVRAKFTQGALTSLTNVLTNENYVATAGPNFVDMTMLQPTGGSLTPGNWVVNPTGTSATIEFRDSVRTVRMTAAVVDNELSLRFEGFSTTTGVISLTWGIFGLSLSPGRLLIPGQGGTYFDRSSTPSAQGLDYPVHWENQMVVYQGSQGNVLMYARDPVPTFKRLHASRQTGNLDMAFEMFAPAPWPGANSVPAVEWRIRGFSGSDWKPAADAYKNYLTAIRPFSAPSGNRSWIRNIRGVVIFQTLDQALLDQLAQELVPSQTLLLLADWRASAFDINYPDYTPSPLAKPFMDRARQLGFRIMLHINLLGVSETNPEYAGMKQFQIKTADELKEIGWLWDEFPSRDIHRIAYISPASSQYRQLLIRSMRTAIDSLQPDAMHLDAGGAITNDGNGLIENMNGMQGMMQLHREIMAAYPGLVLGGESTNEIIAPFNWLAQRWPADSPPHPISTYLLGDQVFFYGFLDQPAPDESGFADYMKRYEGLGVIPVPFIVTPSDLGPDRKRTHDFLDYIRMFQTNQYRPDFTGDWNTARFRYRSADGTSTATLEDDGTFVRFKKDGTVIYQRAHDANVVTTPHFIDNWPAYDSTRLLGTDPNRQFWLENAAFRPFNQTHLSNVPTNFQIGLDSFVADNYAFFQIEGVQRRWFDPIVEFPAARKGTIYNLQEFGVINGAVIQTGRAVVAGQLYNTVLLHNPPFQQAVGGTTFVEYRVAVPVAPKAELKFHAAMIDGTAQSDGVLMGVQIDGTTVWRTMVVPGNAWYDGVVDITSYGGRTVTLRLLTHPGLLLNAQFDQACWRDIRIETDFSTTANLQVELPTGVTPQFGAEAQVNSISGQVANVSLALPGHFTVFTATPPNIPLGGTLLNLPVKVWKASNEGLPFQFAYENSGNIGVVASGGVTKNAIAAIPPRRGATILTFAGTVPANANTLTVGYALADAPPVFGTILDYSGAEFIVRVNGTELHRHRIESVGWQQAIVDISPWRGKPALFELTADADENQLFDFAYFSDLTVH
jgi:hypothetical protein